ncbi:MAG: HD domain-containing protein [Candidatus Bathyarchaeia archaeon]
MPRVSKRRGGAKVGEIKDPLYGYISISELDRRLIDTYPVQRLKRIKQLAGSEYVYPSANHTRFEHCLGVMHLANRLTSNVNVAANLEDKAEEIRIACLLHDVGHGPFSHVFEALLQRFGKSHEDLSTWVIERSEVADIIDEAGYDPKEISKLSIGKSGNHIADQFIRSSIDVDKMDFIVRDNYHTGAGYGNVDVSRIIDAIDVLEENLAVNINSISALEAFLIARMESFRTIYFHRTSRAAQLMLAEALLLAQEDLSFLDLKSVEEYLRLDDYTTWSLLEKCDRCKGILERLKKRDLLKCCYDSEFYSKRKIVSRVFSSDEIRGKFRRDISDLSKVPEDKIFIDVPTLPTVPYRHSIQLKPMEIPIFREEEGMKTSMRASEVSPVIESLRVFLSALRVYTDTEHREEVRRAARKVLGTSPPSLRLSY